MKLYTEFISINLLFWHKKFIITSITQLHYVWLTSQLDNYTNKLRTASTKAGRKLFVCIGTTTQYNAIHSNFSAVKIEYFIDEKKMIFFMFSQNIDCE